MYGAEPLRYGDLFNTITKLAYKRVRQRRRDLDVPFPLTFDLAVLPSSVGSASLAHPFPSLIHLSGFSYQGNEFLNLLKMTLWAKRLGR
jgi:hypothetical protein